MVIKEEEGKVVMEPSMSVEEEFGSGGKEMRKVAIEISKERRREVESEREKQSL